MDCPIPVPPEAGLEVGTPASIHQHDGLEVNWGATKSGLHGAWTASDVEAESAVKGKPSRRCQRETILGLRVAWFWAVIVVLVILLAGGVGGGIAGGVARRESSVDQGSSQAPMMTKSITIAATPTDQTSSSTTPTSSNTITSIPTSISNTVISSPCQGDETGANNTDIKIYGLNKGLTGSDASTFNLRCNWTPSALTTKQWVVKLWTPDFESCMRACADYNFEGTAVPEMQMKSGGCSFAVIDRNTSNTATGQQACLLIPYTGDDTNNGTENLMADSAVFI